MSNSGDKMTSSQPYLLRALNEWIVDNGSTPQILVDSTSPDVNIPDAVRGGEKVVLNISPSAVRDLEIDNEYVSFVARFSGVSHAVLVPVEAVQAIYARETGHGMMFPDADPDETSEASETPTDDSGQPASRNEPARKRGKPNLKVIK